MKGHVLIADDEEPLRRLASRWLEADGHRVTTAADADSAVAAFARGGIDLVLLDLVMPPARTPEAGLGLVRNFPGVPVIVLTGHAQRDLALKAVAEGAWDFLGKPVDPELLRFAVGRALEKAALEQELRALRSQGDAAEFGLLGLSESMARLRSLIRRVAPSDLGVLILGPSGTGKELVARGLHAASARAAHPFVAVHCGAIPAELLESELFGYVKGAFTGADRDRPGLVRAAQGGTLFLDEVGEMPPPMQVKLLRFLQEGAYLPVGGREPQGADVRVVAATHRDLPAMAAEGGFREDLFYRLKGLVLRTPALADRAEDIPLLAQAFLRRAAGERPLRFSAAALAWLQAQEWPGNVRELQSVVRSAAVLADAGAAVVGPDVLAFARTGEPPADVSAEPEESEASTAEGSLPAQVAALERRLIRAALADTGGNHSEAARRLGISRVGLLKKIDRLGLRR
jgi:DNA-binding NtrC family response regulator